MSSEEAPGDLYFDEEHEWVRVEDSKVRVGITDHAQDQLGDIVFVEPPEVGKQLESGSELGSLESIKAVSGIQAPVSGEIIEVNEELEDEPELINSDPFGDGWICVLGPSDLESELDGLMDSDSYEEFLESEE